MIVKNESENLHQLLSYTADLFDQVCVCDTGSTDDSVDVAELYGATVVTRQWDEDFAAARNTAIDLCDSDWIIWLDADDRMYRDDLMRLRMVLGEMHQDQGVYLYLLNVGPNDSCNQLRVFPNLPGIRFDGAIHEQVIHKLHEHGIRDFFYYPLTVHHHGYKDKSQLRGKFVRNFRISLLGLMERRDTNPIERYYIAQTLDALGYKPEGLSVYRSLLPLNPEAANVATIVARSHVSVAERMIETKDYEGASKILESGCARFRDDDLMWLTLAKCRHFQGRYREAIQHAQFQINKGFNPGLLPYSVQTARWLADQIVWESEKKIMLDGYVPPDRTKAA